MSTQFDYQVNQQADDYIRVSLSGVAGVKEIIFMYQDVCDVAGENQFNKLLIDATDVKMEFAMTEFVPMMKKLSVLLADFKVARLCNVFEFRQDLIESVSVKSNIVLKNFTAESEAIDWLLS